METVKNPVVISNNVFKGVVWNKKSIKAVNKVAQALLNLTELFKSQNIKIDCMIKVNDESEKQI